GSAFVSSFSDLPLGCATAERALPLLFFIHCSASPASFISLEGWQRRLAALLVSLSASAGSRRHERGRTHVRLCARTAVALGARLSRLARSTRHPDRRRGGSGSCRRSS